MPTLLDESTQYTDSNGTPIVDGKLYISTKGTDGAPDGGGNPSPNLITIYADRELTTPLSNPQTTGSTGRVLNKIWLDDEYALLLHDSNGVQKYQDLDAGHETVYTNAEIDAKTTDKYYDTLADLITNLVTDKIAVDNVIALKERTSGNGGGLIGDVITDTGGALSTAEGGFRLMYLGSDLTIQLRVENTIFSRRFGAYPGASSVVNTGAIQAAIDYANSTGKGVVTQAGVYDISSLDFEDFNGAFFIGDGKGATSFLINGIVDKAFILNSGSGGSSGTINNCRIGMFNINCSSATVTTAVYADKFTRSELFDIQVTGAQTSFRLGYSWLTIQRRLTSINHTAVGFVYEAGSINSIICEGLSATTTTATAIHYKVLANSITFIRPTSEGTPLEGFQIDDGSRSVVIDGIHVEGADCGIYSDVTTTNGGMLSIINGAFFSCDDILTMRQKCSHLDFRNNSFENSTIANIAVEINADSLDVRGNHIEGGTAQEEVDMYTFNSVNNMDFVRVSESSRSNKFNSVDFKFYDRSIAVTTSATDIGHLKDITVGSAGELTITQRLSGTNTSVEKALWRVNEDGSIAWSSISSVGTALITALTFNGTTNKLQITAAITGTASLRMNSFTD